MPKVTAYSPEGFLMVSGVSRGRLCRHILQVSGAVFTCRPRLLASGAKPIVEFGFRGVQFQVVDGGDTGRDGLWISANDELPHPAELSELREHLNRLLTR